METLNILFEISIYSAVIFIAIMLLKACFKSRMSPLLHYAIWLVLVLRLMMPVTVASPVHLFILPAEPQSQNGEEVQPDLRQPMAPSNINIADIAATQPLTEAASDMPNETQEAPAAGHTPLSFNLPQIVTLVWLAGAGVCLMYLMILYISMRRKLSKNAARPSKRLMDLFNEVKAEMGIEANVKLICQYGYGTPSLMFPGTILMPADALIAMNDEQTMFALRHELMHFKRGDHIASILLSLLNAVYWFNPFVWIAFRQMRKDMETACDGAVVKYFCAAARSRYASLILSLSAKPAHRQLILGMSRSATRKAAEQRVKGIFMKGETKMSVKLISVLLAAALLFTCFTTACQPTPEREVVVNKGGDKLANKIEATPAPKEKYQAPPQYKQEVQSFYDDMLSVSFDMQVETPDVSAYPVYTVKDADLTQQQVNRIVSALMQDRPLKYYDERDTKQEITDRFLLPEKKRLSEAKSGKKFSDDGGNISIEQIQSNIEMYEQWIVNAPETKDEHAVTAEEYTTAGTLLATADLGKSRPATLKIAGTGQTFYYVRFINGTEYIYNGFSEPAGDMPLKTTKEQAVAMAEQLVADMGAEDFTLAAVGKTTRLGSEYDISSDEYQNTMAYSVVFTRTVDGIPLTYTPIDSIGISDKDKMDAQMWSYERIMVNIDDGGVANVFWNGNLEVGACVNENVRLMKFEDIATRALEQIKVQHAYLTDQGKEGEGIRQEKLELDINRAKLGFARIRVKDSAEYQIVPVWDFFGSTTYYFNENDVEAFNKKHGGDIKSTESYDNGYRAIVTVNAVDGSVIDRNLGY